MSIMSSPLFSITIPAFKGRFLSQAIESVLSQTFNDFELIVLNDCSPEIIEDIVKNYKDDRIKYFENKENTGIKRVTDNWNKCLNLACGEYIICMGDDDMLQQDALAEYALLITKYPQLNAFHSRSIIIDENNAHVAISNDRAEHESLPSFLRHRLSGERSFIGDYCFKTSRLKQIGGYYYLPSAWFSDEVTAYLCSTPNGIAHINKPTFLYRSNPQTITNSGNTELKLSAWLLYKDWLLSFIESNHQCTDPIKQLEWLEVRKIVNISLAKAQYWDLLNDMHFSKKNVIKWLLLSKKYKISLSNLVKAYIKSYSI